MNLRCGEQPGRRISRRRQVKDRDYLPPWGAGNPDLVRPTGGHPSKAGVQLRKSAPHPALARWQGRLGGPASSRHSPTASVASGRLTLPVSATYPLADAPAALTTMTATRKPGKRHHDHVGPSANGAMWPPHKPSARMGHRREVSSQPQQGGHASILHQRQSRVARHLALAVRQPGAVPTDEANDNFPHYKCGHPGSSDDNKPARRCHLR
jgi:hypothetical protein